jgi:2-keto-4-pentenoate hydratase/2-oxohepta-3-ene-1,7-dioic acid hydratase in catechol pathway
MRIVSFAADGGRRLGALDGDTLVDLRAAAGTLDAGDREAAQVFRGARALLAAGERGLDLARSLVARSREDGSAAWRRPLDRTTLLPPVPNPRKIFALAGNYVEHVREAGWEPPNKAHTVPQVFVKPVTTLIGHEAPIRLPGPLCTHVDYEGELVAVIGRRGTAIDTGDALAFVGGYACYNDVSGRRLEIGIPERETTPRTGFFDWLNGKWFNTFGPCGPWLVTADEVPDPQALRLETRINGEARQRSDTGAMIFSVAETVAWISRFVELEPGDLIATGTPSGVGSTSGRFLQAGDVVEVEIERLGTLRNPVVAHDAAR